MEWLILLAVVVTSAFAFPRFGKALLALVGVLLVLLVVAGVLLYLYERRQEAERAAAKTRIARSEIEFVDLALRPSYGRGWYRLVGRVRNRSPRYTLRELRLKLVMRDCRRVGDCEIVGETDEAVYLSVPPGQAREIDEDVHFYDLGPPRGKYQWEYSVTEIVGQ